MDRNNTQEMESSEAVWRFVDIDESVKHSLSLKDCFLMMLSCLVKFEDYLKKNDDGNMFCLQTELAKLLLMTNCDQFGFEKVVIQNNNIGVRENQGNDGKKGRGFKFNQDSLFDTFIETYIEKVNKSEVRKTASVRKSQNILKSHSSPEREKTPRKIKQKKPTSTSKETKERSLPLKKQNVSKSSVDDSLDNQIVENGFTLTNENNGEIQKEQGPLASTSELPNKNEQNIPKKQGKKRHMVSPGSVRRSARPKKPIPIDRQMIIHRNIQRALGKSEQEISISYLEMKNRTNRSFALLKNTSTPLVPNKEKKKSAATKNNSKITIHSDVLLSANDADSEGESRSPKAKKPRRSTPAKFSGQRNRDLTPIKRQKVHKLCSKVPTLPTKSDLKIKKEMNQKRKFLSATLSKTGLSATRKLYSQENWLDRLRTELRNS